MPQLTQPFLANPGQPSPAQLLAGATGQLINSVQGDPTDPTQMVAPTSMDPTQQQVSDAEQAPINERPGLAESYAHVQARRMAPHSAGGMSANRATMQSPQAQHIQQYQPGSQYISQGMLQDVAPGTQAATTPGSYSSFNPFSGGASSSSTSPSGTVDMIKAGTETPAPREDESAIGPQPGGGRIVQLIRGGQESYQHFNAKGEQEGGETATPAKEGATQAGGFDAAGMYRDAVKTGMTSPEAYKFVTEQQNLYENRQAKAVANTGKISPADRLRLNDEEAAFRKIKAPGTFSAPGEVEAYNTKLKQHTAFQDSILDKGSVSAEGETSPGTQTAEKATGMPAVTTGSTKTAGPHPPAPGVKLDKSTALIFYQMANGDKDQAQKMATDAGWGVE